MLTRLRTPVPLIERFRVEIDYGLSDVQILEDGGYQLVDSRIYEPRFGLFETFPLGRIMLWANLLQFAGENYLPPIEALNFIRTSGTLRPAVPFEFHTVGAKHRHQQIIRPIMAEDVTTTRRTGCLHLQCLTRSKEYERILVVLPAHRIQEDDYRYLAIDRFWS